VPACQNFLSKFVSISMPTVADQRQSKTPSLIPFEFSPMSSPRIILGSGSSYRRQLLEKLKLIFEQLSPDIDETPHPGESAPDLCQRLARSKANVISGLHPDAIVIASDQCAALGATLLGKPGTRDNAIAQLQACSGKTVRFFTALCVYDGNGRLFDDIDSFDVTFRELSQRQIERYVEIDQPLDCAGSFKSEGYGITLLRRMNGDDPNTLIGLPLIKLIDLLEKAGVSVL
jgi:septum formation protein